MISTSTLCHVSSMLNGSVMPYLQLTDAGSITVQKDVKGAITHTNKGVVRRMFVVNEPFSQATTQSNFRVITTGSAASSISQHKKQDILSMACDYFYDSNDNNPTNNNEVHVQWKFLS
ncbi:hypothetical protein Bhyg_01839 [Pseudolycoriella hygida]|uniref:Uncharacterized protein n=1 Tax=Pseudolycoriella hygida TaxID=35572 RepID=A0A9Q0NBK3_9DIPT|nr:hypothetical protein Bhyg_01839 [Pseudolycoriella hygida]